MLTPNKISTWSFQDIKNFLNHPSSVENNFYEYKETHRIEPEKIRKFFSSFANSDGGYIFFGINNNRRITGVNEDTEINTRLNRCLSNNCLQPPLDKWDLIKTILIPRTNPKKVVYIYYVRSTLSIKKPHIADGKIYMRENGESKSITSGISLRQKFFLSKFYPEHIELLEYELKKIKEYKFEFSYINWMYLLYLEQYLEKSVNENSQHKDKYENLLEKFKEIKVFLKDIESSRANIYSSTGIPPLGNMPELEDKYINLARAADVFLINFNRVHKL